MFSVRGPDLNVLSNFVDECHIEDENTIVIFNNVGEREVHRLENAVKNIAIAQMQHVTSSNYDIELTVSIPCSRHFHD